MRQRDSGSGGGTSAGSHVDPTGFRVLNLGCGRARTDFPEAHRATEIVGIDASPLSEADIIHDLEDLPWPIDDDAFDLVIMQDLIEHLDNVPGVLKEVHRVARDGAIVRVRTPHYSSRYAYGDPTHKRFFSSEIFDLFDVDGPGGYFGPGLFRIVERRLDFPKVWRITGMAWLANRFRARWEQLFAFIVRAENMRFELRVVKNPGVANAPQH